MPRFTLPFALLLSLLAAPAALAQTSLDGVGRITVAGGWRRTSNDTFLSGYYARPENQGLQRGAPSPGGPLLVATFGYAVSEHVELGVDLFGSAERIRLSGAPQLTTLTYGALLGLRLQTLLEGVGPQGLLPWVGVLGGPTLVLSTFQGQPGTEGVKQAWGLTAGGSLRLTDRWAATMELRGLLARGPVKDLGSVNGGGVWLGLGATYTFDAEPSRPVNW
ncbi:hypothetical protein FGE12_01255 [Aggregicoccus sp. 17bor-14]|uniref:hypothetical protein n=1 Tax=Myxococcaceae TaxID=31 RepID=UPI00129CE6C3|nr:MULTISPECIES: hypothetical protein [Myxococcaceae]MBF5041001.1 hypothetical protein [Simulacricoccus sp. 17bor-14]MRI86788.1 hypothetical protein [Aggregicoccus sp. 17bor-14]